MLIYAIVLAWVFGWLTAYFGFIRALIYAFVLLMPLYVAKRIVYQEYRSTRMQLCSLALVALLSAGATAYAVAQSFENGLDKLLLLDREYQKFQDNVMTMPEFRNVTATYTHRKGGRVYLTGSVLTKHYHDRLIQSVDHYIRNAQSGYHDDVEYPEEPSEEQARTKR